jgi:3-mercaptopyruvate sulfurtransferase SseA
MSLPCPRLVSSPIFGCARPGGGPYTRCCSAVQVPVEEWDKAAKAADIGFGKTAYWDEALGSLGIDASATAVVYDDGRMTNSARASFILQYSGGK